MEAPTYQQLIQMSSKAESEADDDSGSLPTFRVTPVNGSNLPLVLNAGVLIWCYGTTVGTRATCSGIKHKISSSRAW